MLQNNKEFINELSILYDNVINQSSEAKYLIKVFENFDNSIKEKKIEGFNELTIFLEIIKNILKESNSIDSVKIIYINNIIKCKNMLKYINDININNFSVLKNSNILETLIDIYNRTNELNSKIFVCDLDGCYKYYFTYETKTDYLNLLKDIKINLTELKEQKEQIDKILSPIDYGKLLKSVKNPSI